MARVNFTMPNPDRILITSLHVNTFNVFVLRSAFWERVGGPFLTHTSHSLTLLKDPFKVPRYISRNLDPTTSEEDKSCWCVPKLPCAKP
jgi:hypothetical protein